MSNYFGQHPGSNDTGVGGTSITVNQFEATSDVQIDNNPQPHGLSSFNPVISTHGSSTLESFFSPRDTEKKTSSGGFFDTFSSQNMYSNPSLTTQPFNLLPPSNQPFNLLPPSSQPVNPSNQPVDPLPPSNQPINPLPPSNQPVNPLPPSNQPINPLPPSNQSVNPLPPSNQPDNLLLPSSQLSGILATQGPHTGEKLYSHPSNVSVPSHTFQGTAGLFGSSAHHNDDLFSSLQPKFSLFESCPPPPASIATHTGLSGTHSPEKFASYQRQTQAPVSDSASSGHRSLPTELSPPLSGNDFGGELLGPFALKDEATHSKPGSTQSLSSLDVHKQFYLNSGSGMLSCPSSNTDYLTRMSSYGEIFPLGYKHKTNADPDFSGSHHPRRCGPLTNLDFDREAEKGRKVRDNLTPHLQFTSTTVDADMPVSVADPTETTRVGVTDPMGVTEVGVTDPMGVTEVGVADPTEATRVGVTDPMGVTEVGVTDLTEATRVGVANLTEATRVGVADPTEAMGVADPAEATASSSSSQNHSLCSLLDSQEDFISRSSPVCLLAPVPLIHGPPTSLSTSLMDKVKLENLSPLSLIPPVPLKKVDPSTSTMSNCGVNDVTINTSVTQEPIVVMSGNRGSEHHNDNNFIPVVHSGSEKLIAETSRETGVSAGRNNPTLSASPEIIQSPGDMDMEESGKSLENKVRYEDNLNDWDIVEGAGDHRVWGTSVPSVDGLISYDSPQHVSPHCEGVLYDLQQDQVLCHVQSQQISESLLASSVLEGTLSENKDQDHAFPLVSVAPPAAYDHALLPVSEGLVHPPATYDHTLLPVSEGLVHPPATYDHALPPVSEGLVHPPATYDHTLLPVSEGLVHPPATYDHALLPVSEGLVHPPTSYDHAFPLVSEAPVHPPTSYEHGFPLPEPQEPLSLKTLPDQSIPSPETTSTPPTSEYTKSVVPVQSLPSSDSAPIFGSDPPQKFLYSNTAPIKTKSEYQDDVSTTHPYLSSITAHPYSSDNPSSTPDPPHSVPPITEPADVHSELPSGGAQIVLDTQSATSSTECSTMSAQARDVPTIVSRTNTLEQGNSLPALVGVHAYDNNISTTSISTTLSPANVTGISTIQSSLQNPVKGGQEPAVLHQAGQVPAVLHQAGQVPAVLHQAGQVPAVLHQAGQVPAVLHQAGQVPAVLHQAGQVPAVLHQAGQVPVVLHQAGQVPVLLPDTQVHVSPQVTGSGHSTTVHELLNHPAEMDHSNKTILHGSKAGLDQAVVSQNTHLPSSFVVDSFQPQDPIQALGPTQAVDTPPIPRSTIQAVDTPPIPRSTIQAVDTPPIPQGQLQAVDKPPIPQGQLQAVDKPPIPQQQQLPSASGVPMNVVDLTKPSVSVIGSGGVEVADLVNYGRADSAPFLPQIPNVISILHSQSSLVVDTRGPSKSAELSTKSPPLLPESTSTATAAGAELATGKEKPTAAPAISGFMVEKPSTDDHCPPPSAPQEKVEAKPFDKDDSEPLHSESRPLYEDGADRPVGVGGGRRHPYHGDGYDPAYYRDDGYRYNDQHRPNYPEPMGPYHSRPHSQAMYGYPGQYDTPHPDYRDRHGYPPHHQGRPGYDPHYPPPYHHQHPRDPYPYGYSHDMRTAPYYHGYPQDPRWDYQGYPYHPPPPRDMRDPHSGYIYDDGMYPLESGGYHSQEQPFDQATETDRASAAGGGDPSIIYGGEERNLEISRVGYDSPDTRLPAHPRLAPLESTCMEDPIHHPVPLQARPGDYLQSQEVGVAYLPQNNEGGEYYAEGYREEGVDYYPIDPSGYGEGCYSQQQDVTLDQVGPAEWDAVPDAPLTPPRGTPEIFSCPHVRVSFGFGGQIVMVLPSNVRAREPAVVEICMVRDILEDQESKMFIEAVKESTGPFIPGQTPKSSVVNFASSKARRCRERISQSETSVLSGDATEEELCMDEVILWEFLMLLCQQNGVVVPSDVADLLMRDCPLSAKSSSHVGAQEGQQDSIDSLRQLLLSGRKKDALDFACSNSLWGHALMLASRMDEQCRTYVVNRFTASLKTTDPLSTFYTLLLGRPPSFVKPEGLSRAGDWRPHLSMILANKATKLDNASILSLGQSLMSKKRLHAAHLCYHLSDVHFGCYGDTETRYSLFGVDHTEMKPGTYPRPQDLHMMEVFEYAMSLTKHEFALPAFQVFKLLYVFKLVEHGFLKMALKYCEQISYTVVKGMHRYVSTFLASLVEISIHLHNFIADYGIVENEFPSWLSQLQQSTNDILSTDYIPNILSPSPAFSSVSQTYSTSGGVHPQPIIGIQQDATHLTVPQASVLTRLKDDRAALSKEGGVEDEDIVLASRDKASMGYDYNPAQVQANVLSTSPETDLQQFQHYDVNPSSEVPPFGSNSQDFQVEGSSGFPLHQQADEQQYADNTGNQVQTSGSNLQAFPSEDNSNVPTHVGEQQQYNENSGVQIPMFNPASQNFQVEESSGHNNYAPFPQGLPTEHQPTVTSAQGGYYGHQHSEQTTTGSTSAGPIITSTPPENKAEETGSRSGGGHVTEGDQKKEDDNKSTKDADKVTKGKSSGGSGWGMGGLLNYILPKKKNQVHLPDDKTPSIVWDEEKNKWITTGSDEEEKEDLAPPPTDAELKRPLPHSTAPVVQGADQTDGGKSNVGTQPPESEVGGPTRGMSNLYSRQGPKKKGRLGAHSKYIDVLNPGGVSSGGTLPPPGPPPMGGALGGDMSQTFPGKLFTPQSVGDGDTAQSSYEALTATSNSNDNNVVQSDSTSSRHWSESGNPTGGDPLPNNQEQERDQADHPSNQSDPRTSHPGGSASHLEQPYPHDTQQYSPQGEVQGEMAPPSSQQSVIQQQGSQQYHGYSSQGQVQSSVLPQEKNSQQYEDYSTQGQFIPQQQEPQGYSTQGQLQWNTPQQQDHQGYSAQVQGDVPQQQDHQGYSAQGQGNVLQQQDHQGYSAQVQGDVPQQQGHQGYSAQGQNWGNIPQQQGQVQGTIPQQQGPQPHMDYTTQGQVQGTIPQQQGPQPHMDYTTQGQVQGTIPQQQGPLQPHMDYTTQGQVQGTIPQQQGPQPHVDYTTQGQVQGTIPQQQESQGFSTPGQVEGSVPQQRDPHPYQGYSTQGQPQRQDLSTQGQVEGQQRDPHPYQGYSMQQGQHQEKTSRPQQSGTMTSQQTDGVSNQQNQRSSNQLQQNLNQPVDREDTKTGGPVQQTPVQQQPQFFNPSAFAPVGGYPGSSESQDDSMSTVSLMSESSQEVSRYMDKKGTASAGYNRLRHGIRGTKGYPSMTGGVSNQHRPHPGQAGSGHLQSGNVRDTAQYRH